MSRRRKVAVGVLIVAIVALAGWLASLRTGGADGPGGTLAFERLLGAYDIRVAEAERPRDDATFVLFDDFRTAGQARAVRDWVEDGGRLVLADPDSSTAESLDIDPGGIVGGTLTGLVDLATDCVAGELSGVDSVRVRVTARAVDRGQQPGVRCLAGDGGGHVLVADVGAGRVVAIGGRSAFTNELLSSGDNAVFALRAVGWPDTTAVTLATPKVAGARSPGVLDALPSRVVAALIGVVAAVVAFACVRGRRLGMPRDEAPDSPRPVSELTDATGALYRGAGDRGHVAGLLRARATSRLRGALGLARDATAEEIAPLAARVGDVDAERLRALLAGATPVDEAGLLTLAGDIERAVRRVEGGGRTGTGLTTDRTDSGRTLT